MGNTRTLLIICALSIYGISIAQNPNYPMPIEFDYIPQICHNENTVNFIKVQKELNLETLTDFDKMQFKKAIKSEMVKKDYFDDNGIHANETILKSHEHLFPKWYTPPFKTVIDRKGMILHTDYSPALDTKGWQRQIPKTNELHSYEYDEKSKILKSFSNHSSKYLQSHDRNQVDLLERGFLAKYVFQYPSEQDIEAMEDIEYDIKGSSITLVDNENIYKWNLEKMQYMRYKIEHGILLNALTKSYKYNDEFKSFLIYTITNVEPQTFENGDCYDKVSTTVYSDFSTKCDSNLNLDPRSREETKVISKELNLYPNPSSSVVTVELPAYPLGNEVKLYSMSGKLLMLRKAKVEVSKMDLNISNLPQGIYLIKVQQGNTTLSNKFTKI